MMHAHEHEKEALGALGLEAAPLQAAQAAQAGSSAAFAALLEQLARAQRQVAQQEQEETTTTTTTATTATALKRPLPNDEAAAPHAKKLKAEEEVDGDAEGPQAAIREASHASASSGNHNSSSSDEDDDDDDDDDDELAGGKARGGRMKGRFSQSERRLLFGIIREDPELLRSFLHQLKRRIWDGKSWMHEIGTRFNKRAKKKRSHDAVRHHLKLRRPQPTDSRAVLSAEEQEVTDFLHLLEHSSTCSRRDACARCLQLSRLRVRRGLARCGYPGCEKCDPALPHVLDDFDVRGLLRCMQQHEQHRHYHEQQQQRHHRLQLNTLNITNPALAASIRKAEEEKANSSSSSPMPERRNSAGSTCSTASVASLHHQPGMMLPHQQKSGLFQQPSAALAHLQASPNTGTNMTDLIKFLGAGINPAASHSSEAAAEAENAHTATLMRLLQEQRERQAMLSALLAANVSNARAMPPLTPLSNLASLNFSVNNGNSVNPDPKSRPTPRAFSDFEVSLAETLAQASRKQ